jgi:hypothetical protein
MLVILVVALINTTWQLLRAWLPKFLQEGGLAENEAYTSIRCFVATDVGTLGLEPSRYGWRQGRPVVRPGFSLSSRVQLPAYDCPTLPSARMGPITLLMIAGAGALGRFRFTVYSRSVTSIKVRLRNCRGGGVGIVSTCSATIRAHVDETHSFDQGLAVAGCTDNRLFTTGSFLAPHNTPEINMLTRRTFLVGEQPPASTAFALKVRAAESRRKDRFLGTEVGCTHAQHFLDPLDGLWLAVWQQRVLMLRAFLSINFLMAIWLGIASNATTSLFPPFPSLTLGGAVGCRWRGDHWRTGNYLKTKRARRSIHGTSGLRRS